MTLLLWVSNRKLLNKFKIQWVFKRMFDNRVHDFFYSCHDLFLTSDKIFGEMLDGKIKFKC